MNKTNILIVALLAVLAIFIIHKKTSTPSSVAVAPTPPPQPSPQASQKPALNPSVSSTPGQGPATETPDKPAADTIFCSEFQDKQHVLIRHELAIPFLKKKVTRFIVPKAEAGCVEGHSYVNFAFAYFNRENPEPFAFIQDTSFNLTPVTTYPSSADLEKDDKALSGTGYDEVGDLVNDLATTYGYDGQGSLVSFDINPGSVPLFKFFYYNPAENPFAKTVDKATVADMLAKGAVLIDTRPSTSAQGHSIDSTKTVSLPISDEKKQHSLISFSEMNILGFGSINSPLIKGHETNLIVSGDNSLDLSAYNTITYLHYIGYKNLFYFRGGYGEWIGNSTDTPTSMSGVQVIKFEDLRNKLSSKNVAVIDVRGGEAFKKGSIENAVNITYQQKRVGFFPVFRAKDLGDPSRLAKDDFNFPVDQIPKSAKEVILYGSHDLDIKPFKAAAILASTGRFQQVSVYRNGFAEWEYAIKILGLKNFIAHADRKMLKKLKRSEKTKKMKDASNAEKKMRKMAKEQKLAMKKENKKDKNKNKAKAEGGAAAEKVARAEKAAKEGKGDKGAKLTPQQKKTQNQVSKRNDPSRLDENGMPIRKGPKIPK